MVPERHEYVARIAPYNNIFGVFSQAQTVLGQVAFHASTMILRRKLCDEFVNGCQAHVDPWREVFDTAWLKVLKNKVKHNVLGPRRAGFDRCRNNDIASPFRNMVPARAIQQEILVDVLAVGCCFFQCNPPVDFVGLMVFLTLSRRNCESTVSSFSSATALRSTSHQRNVHLILRSRPKLFVRAKSES